ncbi:BON domain-containing protein [Hydrocarboniphaga sp.]|uniref:BON domain-containing protein n=1 Tax=Hydrocarboniphaga sp. TaxID=2033016 RepID=UPI003D139C44
MYHSNQLNFFRRTSLGLVLSAAVVIAAPAMADSSESAPEAVAPLAATPAVAPVAASTPAAATQSVAMSAPAEAAAPISGVEARILTGAEVVEDITPYTMTQADRDIAAKVIDILSNDPKLRGRIAVSVLNGEVLLSGKVKSVPMIYRAVELSRKVVSDGKVNVDNLWRG